eukprot:7135129-Ditylum_brightwellii.AAC.1
MPFAPDLAVFLSPFIQWSVETVNQQLPFTSSTGTDLTVFLSLFIPWSAEIVNQQQPFYEQPGDGFRP